MQFEIQTSDHINFLLREVRFSFIVIDKYTHLRTHFS